MGLDLQCMCALWSRVMPLFAYRIAGNVGRELNLAVILPTAEFKFANILNCNSNVGLNHTFPGIFPAIRYAV